MNLLCLCGIEMYSSSSLVMNLVVYHCMSAYRLPSTCKAPVLFRLLVPGITRITTCTFWGPRFGVVVAGSFRSSTELAGRLRLQAYVVTSYEGQSPSQTNGHRPGHPVLSKHRNHPVRGHIGIIAGPHFPQRQTGRKSQQTVYKRFWKWKGKDRGLCSHPDQPRCWDRGGRGGIITTSPGQHGFGGWYLGDLGLARVVCT